MTKLKMIETEFAMTDARLKLIEKNYEVINEKHEELEAKYETLKVLNDLQTKVNKLGKGMKNQLGIYLNVRHRQKNECDGCV